VKKVELNEILPLAEYEKIRDHFRARVIQEKKMRRLNVGPHASFVFENHDSVLTQIQEMLRTERITKESSVQHEIDTYNQLIPAANELSITLMIEINDKEPREAFLDSAVGFERNVSLVVNGESVNAVWEKEREQTERASAVMYLKFPLTPPAANYLRGVLKSDPKPADARVSLRVTHPAYPHEVSFPPHLVASIAEDLV